VSKSVLGKGLGELLDGKAKPIEVNGLGRLRPRHVQASEVEKGELNPADSRQAAVVKKTAIIPLSLVSFVLFWIDLFICCLSWLLFCHSNLQPLAQQVLLVAGFVLGAASSCLGLWLLDKKIVNV